MNFRDVLKALALYPAETADARVFGDEVGRRGENRRRWRHAREGRVIVYSASAVFGLATRLDGAGW